MSYEYEGGNNLSILKKVVGFAVAVILLAFLIVVGTSITQVDSASYGLYITFWVLLGVEHVIMPVLQNNAGVGYYSAVIKSYFW